MMIRPPLVLTLKPGVHCHNRSQQWSDWVAAMRYYSPQGLQPLPRHAPSLPSRTGIWGGGIGLGSTQAPGIAWRGCSPEGRDPPRVASCQLKMSRTQSSSWSATVPSQAVLFRRRHFPAVRLSPARSPHATPPPYPTLEGWARVLSHLLPTTAPHPQR